MRPRTGRWQSSRFFLYGPFSAGFILYCVRAAQPKDYRTSAARRMGDDGRLEKIIRNGN
jgi:hypothetical protein